MKRLWTAGAISLLLFVPAAAQSSGITIADVLVIVGFDLYDATSVGWHLPVTLQAGERLLLTQNGGDFDLARQDYLPLVGFSVNGHWRAMLDYPRTLTARHTEGNAATDWMFAFAEDKLEVYLGFADNMTPGACGAPRCFPTDFFAPTVFQGAFGYRPLGHVATEPDHCLYGAPACMKAAAILFVNTEVSTVVRGH